MAFLGSERRFSGMENALGVVVQVRLGSNGREDSLDRHVVRLHAKLKDFDSSLKAVESYSENFEQESNQITIAL